MLARELLEHAGDHPRRELLRGQPVATADDGRHQLALPGVVVLAQGREHVQEKRLAEGARLLGAVQHGDAPHASRERPRQLARRERPVEPDLRDAHPLPLRLQVRDRLAGGLPARSHHDQHALGFGVAAVVDQRVVTARPLAETVHRALHDLGHARIERVDGLARLEVDVGVLRGTANERPLRRQRSRAMRADQLVRDQGTHVVVVEHLDRLQLVRGAKAVEEVQERDTRLERRGVGHEREVVRLLHRRRRQQREAGLTNRHHVRVVAEDRQRLRRQRSGGHVHYRRRQLTGDLVHVRDHQQQALGRREGGPERPALERAVQGPRGTALALHLHDRGDRAPEVRPPLARPLVGELGHRRGRRDREDAADLAASERDRHRRFVAVNGCAHQRTSTIGSGGATNAY